MSLEQQFDVYKCVIALNWTFLLICVSINSDGTKMVEL